MRMLFKKLTAIFLAVLMIMSVLSVVSVSASQKDDKGQYMIKFVNTKNWSDIFVHAWNSSNPYLCGNWPGWKMENTFIGYDSWGNSIIWLYIPGDATGFVVSNGQGDQTNDITDFSPEGYWVDDNGQAQPWGGSDYESSSGSNYESSSGSTEYNGEVSGNHSHKITFKSQQGLFDDVYGYYKSGDDFGITLKLKTTKPMLDGHMFLTNVTTPMEAKLNKHTSTYPDVTGNRNAYGGTAYGVVFGASYDKVFDTTQDDVVLVTVTGKTYDEFTTDQVFNVDFRILDISNYTQNEWGEYEYDSSTKENLIADSAVVDGKVGTFTVTPERVGGEDEPDEPDSSELSSSIVSEPTTEPSETVSETESESGEGVSGEPTSDYYLVGNINGDNSWGDNIHTELCFVPNEEAEGEYMLSGVELSAGDSIKVAEYKDGMVTWYPDGFENDYGIEADGLYTIYFRPDGQGGEDWHEGYFFLDAVEPPETTEPSETVSETESESGEGVSGEPTSDYYLVGNINGDNSWGDNIHTELCFVPNEEAEGEYMLSGVELSAGDSIKVVEYKDGMVTWYPDGFENDYGIEADGLYTIYFRPDGQGGEDWHEGYFFLDAVEPPETTEPSETVSETESESGEGVSGEPTSDYYLVGNINGDNSWGDNIHTELCFVPNEEAEGEYMLSGVELSAGDSIKVAEYKDGMVTWYPDGIENDYGIEADGLYTIYFRPDGQGGEDWHEGYFYVEVAKPSEETTEAPEETTAHEVTTEEPEETTTIPEETDDPSIPLTAQVRLNGVVVKSQQIYGDTLRVTYMLTSPDPVVDAQATLTYDNKKLRFKSWEFPLVGAAVIDNTNVSESKAAFNFTSPKIPFDFSAGQVLVTANFKVVAGSTGNAKVDLRIEELDTKDKSLVTNGVVEAVGQSVFDSLKDVDVFAGYPPSETETETETESRTEAETVTESGTEAETATESGTEIETATESGTEAETATESRTEAETVTESGTEAETATESGTEIETATESGTEAETATEAEETTEYIPDHEYNFLPDKQDYLNGCDVKLIIRDSVGSYHTYQMTKTPLVYNGVPVFSATVPGSIVPKLVQFQVYYGEVWRGQLTLTDDLLSNTDGKIITGDGSILGENEPTTTATAPATQPYFGVRGDVDGNESFDVRDATAIKQFVAELIELSPQQQLIANVNNDDVVDVRDATALQQILAELRDFDYYD